MPASRMTFAHFAPSALIWAANSSGLFPTGSKPSACVRSCTSGNHDVPRYACRRGALDNGEPRCIEFGGLRVDDAIEEELLRVLEPAAIDAALEADSEETRHRDEVLEALKRDLEAARYAADKAFRQYDATDPANRLVAAELELRWNRVDPATGNFTGVFISGPAGSCPGVPYDLAGRVRGTRVVFQTWRNWTPDCRVTTVWSGRFVSPTTVAARGIATYVAPNGRMVRVRGTEIFQRI
jgi:hypothetical protein